MEMGCNLKFNFFTFFLGVLKISLKTKLWFVLRLGNHDVFRLIFQENFLYEIQEANKVQVDEFCTTRRKRDRCGCAVRRADVKLKDSPYFA